jgi:hypothetical protein
VNPRVTRRTERLKTFLPRESRSVRKNSAATAKFFSSIAHYEQSSKKFFAAKPRFGSSEDAFDREIFAPNPFETKFSRVHRCAKQRAIMSERKRRPKSERAPDGERSMSSRVDRSATLSEAFSRNRFDRYVCLRRAVCSGDRWSVERGSPRPLARTSAPKSAVRERAAHS